mmetsp:Transcript_48065/g.112321  ORF Transcript_48065/g.112321 Transcript_48065/m.112321 type:complete len:2082 (-) Transcript_48065:260-6505(-)
MGNCSSAPRLKVNLKAFIAANPPSEACGEEWYFDTMNAVLDRWAYSHVQFLKKKFVEATGDKSEKELDKKGFFKLFAELQDMPKAVAESAFRMFDTDNSGKLTFREFCCALALCCHLMSSDDEKIRFVFDMFDTNDDGLLNSSDVQLLLDHVVGKEDARLGGDGRDEDTTAMQRRQQRVTEMSQELLGTSQYLTYERFYEWARLNIDRLTNLLHTFQIVPSPERERAVCEEMLSRHQTLQEGGTWYCISYKWLQIWKAHVGWRGPSPGRQGAGAGQGLLGGPATSAATYVGHDRHELRSSPEILRLERGMSGEDELIVQDDDLASEEPLTVMSEASTHGVHAMFMRPPEIDNSDLEGEHKGELKMNLVEHLDFELIPEEMWHRLVEWYGGGPAIPRKVICMGEDRQAQVELYPTLVLVVVAGESGQPLPQFSRRFFISRQASLAEVLHMLGEKLSRPPDKSRLWHRVGGQQWRLVQHVGATLEEFLEGKVWDAGAFLLETQKSNGDWPRQEGTQSQALEEAGSGDVLAGELQRQFEVGDRVEAQNGVTNQWTRGTIVDVVHHSQTPSQVKVHYDSTVYRCDEWIPTTSERLAPLGTHITGSLSVSQQMPGSEIPLPVRGATGLQNIGNTCFLNAMIQCLANTPLLREYFLSMQFLRDFTDRRSGCKGRLAEEFGHVVAELWGGKTTCVTPRNLKRTIDHVAPQFAGYEQHDAQELLAFFLEGLHEDLNRATSGPSQAIRGGAGRREASGTPKLFSRTKHWEWTRVAGGSAMYHDNNNTSPKRARQQSASNGWNATKQPEPSAPLSPKQSSAATTHSSAEGSATQLPASSRERPSAELQQLDQQEPQPFHMDTALPAPAGSLPSAPGPSPPMQDGLDEDPLRSIEALTGDNVGPIEGADPGALSFDLPPEEEFVPDPVTKAALPPHATVINMPQGAPDGSDNDVLLRVPSGHIAVSEVQVQPRTLSRDAGQLSDRDSVREALDSDGFRGNMAEEVDSERPEGKSNLPAMSVQPYMPKMQQRQAAGGEPPSSSNGSGQTPRPAPQPAPSVSSSSNGQPRSTEAANSMSKRPGTSRWWSFAWRRGRGALDLPKEPLPDGATEADKRDAAEVRELETNSKEDNGLEPVEVLKQTSDDAKNFPPRLPGIPGPAGLAVAAATAARCADTASEVGTVGTFNESEDFVPELLTTNSTSTIKRSLTLLNLMRRKRDDDSASQSPKRRTSRTLPTMQSLKEDYSTGEPDMPPVASETTADGTVLVNNTDQQVYPLAVTPPLSSSSRSFLPRKGPRTMQERRAAEETVTEECPGDLTDEADGPTSNISRSRMKEKESSWPSIFRRSKSRENQPSRRGRSAGRRPVASGDIGAEAAGPSTGLALEEAAHAGAAGSDDARQLRDFSEPRGGYPPDPSEPLRASDTDMDDRPSRAGYGFPFLRPWKRDGQRGPSPAGKAPLRPDSRQPRDFDAERLEQPCEPDCGDEYTSRPLQASSNDDTAGSKESLLKDSLGKSLAADSSQSDQGGQREAASQEEREEDDVETEEDNLPDEEKAARQWDRYRTRNRSLIVDIFEGQLRSQLTCCECGASSSTFEPFRYLSVPIPSNHVDRVALRIIFFGLPAPHRAPLARYAVCVPKNATVQKAEQALSSLLPVPMSSVLLAEVYRSRIHRYLDSSLPLTDVRAEDQLFAFEVPQTPQELTQYQERFASKQRRERADDIKKQPHPRVLIIQAMHRRVVDVCRSDGRTWAQRREVFGLPFVMSAVSTWTYAMLHDMLVLHARRYLKSTRQRRDGLMSMDERYSQMPFVARIVNASGTACGACDRRNCTGCLLPKGNARLRLRAGLLTGSVSTAKIYLALDWVDSGLYDQQYVDNVVEDPSVSRAGQQVHNGGWPEKERTGEGHRSSFTGGQDSEEGPAGSGTGTVPISACIDAFTQVEELKREFGNGVKCDKCNKVVDAIKKLDIWREPDVLIIHIKRFHFSGMSYEKLNSPVEVLQKELSLRPWIVGPSATASHPYDLFAVACHFGGMSGGHYTSFAMNSEGKEPVWLKFNDETVSSVSLHHELDEISRQSYVLFYKKRAFSSSNLINYSSLL